MPDRVGFQHKLPDCIKVVQITTQTQLQTYKDFWDNATEALKLLASADERLETLEKYFTGKDTLNEGPTYTTTTT